MKILLIAGHGEGDPGACYSDYQEATLTRDLLPRLKTHLDSYSVIDVYPMDKNCYKQNKKGNPPKWSDYDYVMELHFNASTNHNANGTEIYVHKTEKGIAVEEKILAQMESIGFKNRGVIRKSGLKNMNTCKAAGVSYALIETCFMSNNDDLYKYNAMPDTVAKAIANGIVNGFGLNTKVDLDPVKSPQAFYRVQVGAFMVKANADRKAADLKAMGIDCFVTKTDSACPYKVQCGAFTVKDNAVNLKNYLNGLGIEAFIVTY